MELLGPKDQLGACPKSKYLYSGRKSKKTEGQNAEEDHSKWNSPTITQIPKEIPV